MATTDLWMECFAGDARVEGDSVDVVADRFVDHARESHDWPYPEEALRNYARNYAEANVRLTGDTKRLSHIGEVTIHPVSQPRIDDWINFFDHDAFAGNPDWASCYCLEPHLPATDENPERPWREVRATMVDRLSNGGTYGYLAYVDGTPAGWVNASPRSNYGMYRMIDPDGPDPASVIGVSCFIIAPPYRRHGLAARLLDRSSTTRPTAARSGSRDTPTTNPMKATLVITADRGTSTKLEDSSRSNNESATR